MKIRKSIKILFLLSLLTFNIVVCQQKTKFENGFSLFQDSITFSVKGKMTHALEYKDKYYVLFEQQLLKYGGYSKRWLYILSKNKIDKIIECPKEFKENYLDFYVKNDSIILKSYSKDCSFHLDFNNNWNMIEKSDDMIFEDAYFYVYSLDFGEWGGKTWFVDKKTKSQYVLECTTPLINKIDKTYFLTNTFEVLKIIDPTKLTKCDKDVTYEYIKKTGKWSNWYSNSIGFDIIYEFSKKHPFDNTDYPYIVSSFVFNNELLHVYENEKVFYLSRIENNKILPFEKILNNVKFYENYNSYRCKNINGTNELLKFNTNNEQISGLINIKENQIFVTKLINEYKLKPQKLGAEKANEIFINRLKYFVENFSKMNFNEIESIEQKWGTFDISPNHVIGIGGNQYLERLKIDSNKSYFILEDSIVSNSIMYYGTLNFLKAITIDWEDDNNLSNEIKKNAILDKYENIKKILIKEFGQHKSIILESKNKFGSLVWKTNSGISIELTKSINTKTEYYNFSITIFKDK